MTSPGFSLLWRRPAGRQITLAGALLALGFLAAVQIQSQSPRARYSSQERPPLVETAVELSQRQDALKASIVELRGEIQAQENSVAADDATVAALNAQLIAARTAAGLVDLTGPGVALQFDDASGTLPPDANDSDYRVQAEDLRDLLTALWLSGAEAIAINNERIVVTTAITDIGGTVLVNSAYLGPPYVVTAIGGPSLYDELVSSDLLRRLLETRVQPFGLQLRAGKVDKVTIPAYSGTLRLIEARAAPSPSPLPGGTP